MRYDAVVRYADETHRAFSSFHLPAHAVSDPAQEVVIVVETVDDDDNDDVDDDDYFTTPPPAEHNKRRRLNSMQTTINPDFCEFVKEGTADGGPVPTRRRRESRAAATPGTTATPHR